MRRPITQTSSKHKYSHSSIMQSIYAATNGMGHGAEADQENMDWSLISDMDEEMEEAFEQEERQCVVLEVERQWARGVSRRNIRRRDIWSDIEDAYLLKYLGYKV